jgi:hypothetical protein
VGENRNHQQKESQPEDRWNFGAKARAHI